MSIYEVTIVGIGKLGGALALALSRNGYKISQLIARNRKKAEQIAGLIDPKPEILTLEDLAEINSDIIFITTQDSEIAGVAEKLASIIEQMPLVFHTSGALSSDVLAPLRQEGCEVASFHPLISVSSSINGAENFRDAYFCLEGDENAVFIGKQVVETLGGKPFSIETKSKALYHAAAVMACGHLVAIVSAAIEMFSKCGVEKIEAQEILLPLIRSTVANLSTQTPAQALTGTFARADLASLQAHLQTLRENMPDEIIKIYQLLGLYSLDLARQQGADEQSLEIMKKTLLEKKAICSAQQIKCVAN